MHLLEELLQVRAPLVPHPRFREQPTSIPTFKDPDTEIDVLTKTHLRKASQFLINILPHSHIETTWIELVQLLFPSTDTSRSKERSHGIVNGLLHIGKRIMSPVRTAECIRLLPLEFSLNLLQISFRENTIRIQYQHIFSISSLHPIVTGLSGTGIHFIIIMYSQTVGIFVHHILTRYSRTILHYNHFKVTKCLSCQTIKQFIHFIGTIVYGYDKRISHDCLFINKTKKHKKGGTYNKFRLFIYIIFKLCLHTTYV